MAGHKIPKQKTNDYFYAARGHGCLGQDIVEGRQLCNRGDGGGPRSMDKVW